MKMITILIDPDIEDAMRTAMVDAGVDAMACTQYKGFGSHIRKKKRLYRGAEYNIYFANRLKVEVIVTDTKVKKVIDTVKELFNQVKEDEDINGFNIYVTEVEKQLILKAF